jgi:phosphatidylglycerophosphatase A
MVLVKQKERRKIKFSGPADFWGVFAGSALGLGLSPVAPGTCGALLGVAIHVSIALTTPANLHLPLLAASFILVCLLHLLLTDWAVKYWDDPDPSNFVLDEVIGYLTVPLLFHHGHLWQVALWGFILFRMFDIIKIWPASYIDRRWHNRWGIFLDDVVSAIYAVGVMYLAWWIGPRLGLERWLISSP